MAIFSTIGGIIGADAQKDSTREAAKIAAQTADKTINFAKAERDRTEARIAPYDARGNIAGATLNALLGLPSAMPMASTPQTPNGAPAASGAGYGASYGQFAPREAISGDQFYGARATNALMPQAMQATGGQGQVTTPGVTMQSANDSFRNYLQNSDYAFQFGEGSNALAHRFGAGGALNSGAAMREMERYKQNLQAGYRGEYMNLLAGQQGAGLGAANALAGVSTNLVNTVGGANQSAGTVAANGALARGNISANLWGGIGSNIGNMAGKILGSSYGGF